MSESGDPSLPASSRAVRLVRQHHGLPERAEASDSILRAASVASGSLRRLWKREARANHLRARRRAVRLEEIPERQYPVILEVDGAKNFVVLLERESENEYRIQFPDTREAIVSRERIEEVYDGTCVFFTPQGAGRSRGDGGHGGNGNGGGRWKRFFSRKAASSAVVSLVFNGALVVGVFGAMLGHESALGSIDLPPLFVSACAVSVAAFFSAGAILLRRECLRDRGAAGWLDLALVPVLLPLAVQLGGWVVLPFLATGLFVAAYLVVSNRLGSVRSPLASFRRPLVIGAFGAAMAAAFLGVAGILSSALIPALGLGSYAVYLLTRSDRLCQQSRLLALS